MIRWLATVLVASASCAACVAPGPGLRADGVAVPRGLPRYTPASEQSVGTAAAIALGRRLFFDVRLSDDRSVACASCHRPGHLFGDDSPTSRGAGGHLARRNTPSLLNVAYVAPLGLDGRSATLEEQVLRPIQDRQEMDLRLGEMAARLTAIRSYRRAFSVAFGEPVSPDGVARALAAYLRTLRSGDSRFDQFVAGQWSALTEQEREGFLLFTGKARCATCHAGPLLSDGEFHNTGVAARSGSNDPARKGVTGRIEDAGAFRTRSLRNVALTAPYMHDGSMHDLEEVIDFYDGGGFEDPRLDRLIVPLHLSRAERQSLAAFLLALTSAGH